MCVVIAVTRLLSLPTEDAAEVRMIFLPAPVNPSLKTYTLVGMSFTGLQAYCAKTPSGKLAAQTMRLLHSWKPRWLYSVLHLCLQSSFENWLQSWRRSFAVL